MDYKYNVNEGVKNLKDKYKNRENNKDNFYETPYPIVDFMCRGAIEILSSEFEAKANDSKVQYLDFAAGFGAFIEGLLKNGVNDSQIKAYELDPQKVEVIKEHYPGVDVENCNTLSQEVINRDGV